MLSFGMRINTIFLKCEMYQYESENLSLVNQAQKQL